MSTEAKPELTGSFLIHRKLPRIGPARSTEDWLLAGFVVLSAVIHLLFVFASDFSLFSDQTPVLEEWSMDAEIVTDIDFGAPLKSALPKAKEAPEPKAPDNMLPQLPKKFAVQESAPEKQLDPDAMIDPTEKVKKAEKVETKPEKIEKKPEDVKMQADKDEQNRLRKSEALERLMKEKLRRDNKTAKTAEAEESSPLARLSREVAKRKALNTGSFSGRLSAQAQQYGGQLESAVTRNYTLPSIYNYKDKKLTVNIAIVVAESGDLRKLAVQQSSGESAFDEFVVDAVKSSAPLPPPPEDLAGKQIILSFSPGSF